MIDWKGLLLSKTVLTAIAGLITGVAAKYGFLVDGVSVESVLSDIVATVLTIGTIASRAVAKGPLIK